MPNGTNNASGKKKKIALLSVGSVLLVAMVVAVAVGLSGGKQSKGRGEGSNDISTSTKAVKAVCEPTDYKETCEKTLTSAAGNTSDPKELIKTGFKVAVDYLEGAVHNSSVVAELAKDPMTNQALQNCKELIGYSVDDINDSIDRLGSFDIANFDDYVADMKVWLTGAVTFIETCQDGFENTTGKAGDKMKELLKTGRELTFNALAMVSQITSVLTSLHIPTSTSRRLMTSESEDEFPSWVNEEKKRLLLAAPGEITADVVVAKDGSGKYKTLNEALVDIPKKSNKTFVIHVKEGVYTEHVVFDKHMTNVMLLGDGPTKTKITYNKNFADGVQTFKTATLAAMGSNFMAKDIGIENSAGAAKHQAVALRIQADFSIIYNCQLDGYQDTLYAHAHRQFYRDCVITGTIDFIFGDAKAIFQNCKMIVRKPGDNQRCIVLAQGRMSEHAISALILQNCTISADPVYFPVRHVLKSYLARPWKNFSRSIIMQSQIDDLIQPEGWLPWMGDFALKTCYFAEFGNRGAGSDTSKRVAWPGVKKIDLATAQTFTPGKFFEGGDAWIRSSGLPYYPNMLP